MAALLPSLLWIFQTLLCCSACCRYPVRMALIDLDAPPSWWSSGANDNLTADEARALAGTKGERRGCMGRVKVGWGWGRVAT